MDKLEKALKKAREQREIELRRKQDSQQPQAVSQAAGIKTQPATPIATIEEDHLELYHVLAHRTRSKEADLFRILRTQVLGTMSQAGYTTLGITSANYGDGKTTVGLNLAVSIALDLKQTVLMVDMDLRKPNVTEYLGIRAPYGITDYYYNNKTISECLIRPNFDRLSILPAGAALDHSSEILGSPKIGQLAHELKTRYNDRIIIYDLPPTLAQDDPLAFLPHVDAVLLVVNEGVTKVSELKQTMNILSGANVIGTVLNHSGQHKKISVWNVLNEIQEQI